MFDEQPHINFGESGEDRRGEVDMDIGEESEPLTVYSCNVSTRLDKLIRSVLEEIPDGYIDDLPLFSVF